MVVDEDQFFDTVYPLPQGVSAEVQVRNTSASNAARIYITHFLVDEDMRRQGIAEDVLTKIEDAAEDCGFSRVEVNISYTGEPETRSSKIQDPTVKLLRKLNYTIELHRNTVTGLQMADGTSN